MAIGTRLERDRDIWILHLGSDENRFTPEWMTAVEAALHQVVANPGPGALVTHAEGKIWSNGLDLDWIENHGEAQRGLFVKQVHRLLATLLELPIPTVAAIQGHAFAAGAMLALAHDWRVMRADRGYFCMPEANLGIPFTPGMTALIQAKVNPSSTTRLMLGAERLSGEAAVQLGVVDQTASEDTVLEVAVALARDHAAKGSDTYQTIKRRMYSSALSSLRDLNANSMDFPAE